MTVPFLFFGLFTLAVIAVLIVNFILERRLREAFTAFAATEGWSYSPDKNPAAALACRFINRFDHGDNHYLRHRLQGTYAGLVFDVFEYHYQVTTGSGKNRRTTHYHFRTAVTPLPRSFPELVSGPEGFFDKIAAAFGFDDIDFESAEFSRMFKVQSPDRKFAYDIIHPRMMEWLLRRPDTTLEIEGSQLVVLEAGTMEPDKVHPLLAHMAGIRERLPAYLLEPEQA